MIPDLESYSEKEIQAAESFSSIAGIYLRMLSQKPANLSEELRLSRQRAWLKSGLATWHRRASSQDICLFWSTEADKLLKKAFEECFDTQDFALFAMGK